VAFDLKVFFTVVAKDPVAVAAVDVFDFLPLQRGDRTVVHQHAGRVGHLARVDVRLLGRRGAVHHLAFPRLSWAGEARPRGVKPETNVR
jgi:hypothetical protein